VNAKLTKLVAALHVMVGLELYLFWLAFYGGFIFPADELRPRIANFEGYYAWETSFTVPDLVMGAFMVFAGIRLFRNPADRAARTILVAASGGCAFLGTLDFVYDFANGMYALDHVFSYILLSVGVLLPPFGILSIYFLHRTAPGQD
jgi:hypothetical protein